MGKTLVKVEGQAEPKTEPEPGCTIIALVLLVLMFLTQTNLLEPSCFSTTLRLGSGSTPRTRTRTSSEVLIVQTLMMESKTSADVTHVCNNTGCSIKKEKK